MSYHNIREEELKNQIARDYFSDFDTTRIVGNIDFCITHKTKKNTSPSQGSGTPQEENALIQASNQKKAFVSNSATEINNSPQVGSGSWVSQDKASPGQEGWTRSGRGACDTHEIQSLLWAEAKKGKSDILRSIVQLILTIGKARTFDKVLPPAFLGAFDADNIAFVPYHSISAIFTQNDFNWNVTPSNHETKEFQLLLGMVKTTIEANSLLFAYATDESEIREFIKSNLVIGKTESSKINIDKNNFLSIYNKWLTAVKPSIIAPWELAKKSGIIDADFYLADLLSENNQSLKESLYVLLKVNHYEFGRQIDESGFFNQKSANFNDNQKAHNQFWNRYNRPPRSEYWDYIIERRDLLVPQDVRERKGSFFTPSIWVDKSQEYLQEVLGENWQDDYYIWDCAAGTGNLLAGLTNKYNIYASTLDTQDVDVMKDRIKNGTNLLADHCFQFDFLNDEFTKLPQSLQDIIADPIKRQKLVIYINPPYAESGTGVGKGFKEKVAIDNKTYLKYKDKLGKASNELFAQFLARIYFEISGCMIGEFSTLKVLTGGNSKVFRANLLAKLEICFIVPADTFDNVKGSFPIGFKIWNTGKKEKFDNISLDVFDAKEQNIGTKKLYSYDLEITKVNDWLSSFKNKSYDNIGILMADAPDFQHNKLVCLRSEKPKGHGICFEIDKTNVKIALIYLAVRHTFEHTWINHNDQFLYPNDNWQNDTEFQNDCLAFSLFHSKNRITSSSGVNHWIPFTETEVDSRGRFASNWMTDYMKGKVVLKIHPVDCVATPQEGNFTVEAPNHEGNIESNSNGLFDDLAPSFVPSTPLEFSLESQAVFDAGRELWRYYHSQDDCSVNASLYDIREYFQGRNEGGKMNNKSADEKYTLLIANLRDALKVLGLKIQPKVYEYGFLKG